MFLNLSGNCPFSELLGYVSYFYTDRTFANAYEERDAIVADIAATEKLRKEANTKSNVSAFLMPGLYFRYQALADGYAARVKVLSDALVKFDAATTAAAQSLREVRAITQAITPDTSIQAIQTAQDLLRQEQARAIVQAANSPKSNAAAAFLIPAVVGVAAGFFL